MKLKCSNLSTTNKLGYLRFDFFQFKLNKSTWVELSILFILIIVDLCNGQIYVHINESNETQASANQKALEICKTKSLVMLIKILKLFFAETFLAVSCNSFWQFNYSKQVLFDLIWLAKSELLLKKAFLQILVIFTKNLHCSGNLIEFSCILDPYSCAILTLNESDQDHSIDNMYSLFQIQCNESSLRQRR